MEGIKTWPSSHAADVSDTGIEKLILLYKRLNFSGDYFKN
jgi:hypothetical protein